MLQKYNNNEKSFLTYQHRPQHDAGKKVGPWLAPRIRIVHATNKYTERKDNRLVSDCYQQRRIVKRLFAEEFCVHQTEHKCHNECGYT